MSIRSTARIAGVSKDTVAKFQLEVGAACARKSDKRLQEIFAQRIQLDEIWAFVGTKSYNTRIVDVPEGKGDCYTFTALDSDSKLMISFMCGQRTSDTTTQFLQDLKGRLMINPQISSDAFVAYPTAIRAIFPKAGYGQVIKEYSSSNQVHAWRRYSPARVTGSRKKTVFGHPVEADISTSHVERANLTIRMGCRRFTRLTNAFSKKLANHIAAQQMFFFHYNFCRVHSSLRQTPAMAAGKTGHIWEIGEVVDLLEAIEPKAKSVWSYARQQAAGSN